jgi:hypothetical protein
VGISSAPFSELITEQASSELRSVRDAVNSRSVRDNKEYTGTLAKQRQAVRLFVRRLWRQESDKAEVEDLQRKVDRFIENFQVRDLLL